MRVVALRKGPVTGQTDNDTNAAARDGDAAVSEQYEAGYAARYRGDSMSVGATRSWQAGWTDASRELGSFEEIFAPSQGSIEFSGCGEEARERGLPFDPSCSELWKRGWIEADIALGLRAEHAGASSEDCKKQTL